VFGTGDGFGVKSDTFRTQTDVMAVFTDFSSRKAFILTCNNIENVIVLECSYLFAGIIYRNDYHVKEIAQVLSLLASVIFRMSL
jgi:hypothetical protein